MGEGKGWSRGEGGDGVGRRGREGGEERRRGGEGGEGGEEKGKILPTTLHQPFFIPFVKLLSLILNMHGFC